MWDPTSNRIFLYPEKKLKIVLVKNYCEVGIERGKSHSCEKCVQMQLGFCLANSRSQSSLALKGYTISVAPP